MYDDLRRGVRSSLVDLGTGRTLVDPPQELLDWLGREFSGAQGLSAYSRPWSNEVRKTIARLLSDPLGRNLRPDEIHYTNGSTEAISLTVQNAKHLGHDSIVLPLPGYFAFEVSAKRWNVPISGYVPTLEQTPNAANVMIAPNGVDGSIPEHGVSPLMIDVPFMLHGIDPLALRDVLTLLKTPGADGSFISLSASKDLAIPGLRVGLLISPGGDATRSITESQIESQYSHTVFHERVCLLYACLVHCSYLEVSEGWSRDAACVQAHDAMSDLAQVAKGLVPSSGFLRLMLGHSDLISRLCRANWAILDGVLNSINGRVPIPRLGYSALLQIDRPSRVDIVSWCNRVGRDLGLKLSPSLLFGGDLGSWRRAYGSEWRFRVNLTQPEEDLSKKLELLRKAISSDY